MTDFGFEADLAERDEVFLRKDGKRILDRFRLDGRNAVVTGAGQGIGRAFAHALGEAGARVAVVGRNESKLEGVVRELESKGIESIAVAANVASPKDIDRYVKTVVDKWGSLTVAVHNAGTNENSAAEETPIGEWDETFNVNLRGVFLGCQAAARIMLPGGYGKIVNIASAASIVAPHPQKQAAYNASKAGVVHLTKSLAAEWADRGVRVNCISPGAIYTPLIETDALRPLVEEWLEQIPIGRLGEVTDLQAAIVYLASEASDYVTGHNHLIEGGHTLW